MFGALACVFSFSSNASESHGINNLYRAVSHLFWPQPLSIMVSQSMLQRVRTLADVNSACQTKDANLLKLL